MAQYLPESPVITVSVIVFSFNIVKNIVIRHDVVKVGNFTRRSVLFKRNLELALQFISIKFIVKLVYQFYYSGLLCVSFHIRLG